MLFQDDSYDKAVSTAISDNDNRDDYHNDTDRNSARCEGWIVKQLRKQDTDCVSTLKSPPSCII